MSTNKQTKTRRNQSTTRTASGKRGGSARKRTKRTTDQASSALASVRSTTNASMQSARTSLQHVGSAAAEMANGAARTVRDNPMPFALAGAGIVCAGAGLTWFLMNNGKGPQPRPSQTLGRGMQSSVQSIKQAGQSVKRAGRAANEKVSQLAHDTVESGRRIEQSVEDVVREHPIAVGAALFATGAAIGLAIPRSAFEDNWVGRERDQLVSSAQRLAQGAAKKVESMAKEVAGASNGSAHA